MAKTFEQWKSTGQMVRDWNVGIDEYPTCWTSAEKGWKARDEEVDTLTAERDALRAACECVWAGVPDRIRRALETHSIPANQIVMVPQIGAGLRGEVMVYVGKRPCGCIIAACFADGQPDSASLQDIGQMVVDGLTVTRQEEPVQFYECPEHKGTYLERISQMEDSQ